MKLREFGSQESLDWVSVVQQIAICQAFYVDSPTVIAEYLGNDATILRWVSQRDTWPPSWALIKQGDDYWVVVEGTTNAWQFGEHVAGYAMADDWLGSSRVNQGWKEVAEGIWAQLPNRDRGHWHYSGHSYGGAVAGILATMHANERGEADKVSLMLVASPAFMTWGYKGVRPKVYHEVESWGDAVPTLPPTGTELMNVRFRSPLEWYQAAQIWDTFGKRTTLGYQGNTDGTLGDVNDRGEMVGNGMPTNHYLPNYWGRINQKALREFPDNVPLRSAINWSRQLMVAEFQSVITEFPNFITLPDGTKVFIPPVQIYRSYSQMSATYKVSFVFVGWNQRTWRESHFCVASSAEDATGKLALDTVMSARLAFLSSLYRVESIEAVNVNSTRDGYVRGPLTSQVWSGVQATNNAETTGVALNVGYFGPNFQQRWAQVRGFSDQAVFIDKQTGDQAIAGTVKPLLDAYVLKLKEQAFGWVKRVPRNPDAPVTMPNYIEKIDGATVPGLSVVTLDRAPGISGGSVTFHRTNKRTLPGLEGAQKVISSSGATIRIPYVVPSGTIIGAGEGSYIRVLQWQDITLYNGQYEEGYIYGKKTRRMK